MKKYFHIFLIALMALSFIGHLVIYPSLPDTIPTHWGFDGMVDGWGPKYMDLILAALPAGMYVLLIVMPKIDPRSASYSRHRQAYHIFITAILLFMIGLSWASVMAAKGIPVNISQICMGALGILLLLTGNYMPQIRPNYTFGIRTPWTIDNEWVWKKTHQAGGVVFCLSGILMAASAFFSFLTVPSFILLIGGSLGLTLYSYLLYRKVKDQDVPPDRKE